MKQTHTRHPRCFQNRSTVGFTLAELLVVILIIAVLAALSIIGLGKFRDSATMAKSTSNLRQIHALAGIYSTENNQRVLPGKGSDNQQWQTLLARQMGKNYVGIWEFVDASGYYRPEVDTFIAPGWTKSQYYNKNRFWETGYGMNMQPGLPSNTSINTGESWGKPFLMDQITAPSIRAFILTWPAWNASYTASDAAKGAFVGKKLNVLFFDGHVETKRPNEISPLFNVPADRAK